jgi:hypothetical protein
VVTSRSSRAGALVFLFVGCQAVCFLAEVAKKGGRSAGVGIWFVRQMVSTVVGLVKRLDAHPMSGQLSAEWQGIRSPGFGTAKTYKSTM